MASIPSQNTYLRPQISARNIQSKVVIRRLPPRLTEDAFREAISPMPENNYFYFVRGNLTLGMGADNFSRAYINFMNQEEIPVFKEKFDNYVFSDIKGNKCSAVVEFAPSQHIPMNHRGDEDSLMGTIDDDSDYIQFLEKLKLDEEKAALESVEEEKKEVVKETTPLLAFVNEKLMKERKILEEKREERKRQERDKCKWRDKEKKKLAEIEKAIDQMDLNKEPKSSCGEIASSPPRKTESSSRNQKGRVTSTPEPNSTSQSPGKQNSRGNFKFKPRPKKDWSNSNKYYRSQEGRGHYKKWGPLHDARKRFPTDNSQIEDRLIEEPIPRVETAENKDQVSDYYSDPSPRKKGNDQPVNDQNSSRSPRNSKQDKSGSYRTKTQRDSPTSANSNCQQEPSSTSVSYSSTSGRKSQTWFRGPSTRKNRNDQSSR